jgi:hypothetical protein
MPGAVNAEPVPDLAAPPLRDIDDFFKERYFRK